ncbi:MAG: hypothetical protein WA118_13690 [Carboxydocellales bacterium]
MEWCNSGIPATKDGGRLAAWARTPCRRGLDDTISTLRLELHGMELRAPNRDRHPTGDKDIHITWNQ